jgi:3'-phosphoadenosine 5'-phosphosulfate sulfotransferase (PAPS reductase)/FAD synthetase
VFMKLNDKIKKAKGMVKEVLSAHKKPVVMCSFGKDSMVLLDLMIAVAGPLPIVFHREPFSPSKYAFANEVIQAMNLTVYDYRPCKVSLSNKNGMMEIMNEYQIGAETCLVPTGMVPPKDYSDRNSYLCGLNDLLLKPLGTFVYPWDVCFLGHKSSDVDPMHGPLPLHLDLKRNPGSASAAFPIREFSDQDVWEYTEAKKLPVHTERYEKVNGAWRERANKDLNPDYFTACTLCMDRNGPEVVRCPKYQMEINNVGKRISHHEVKMDYCGPKEGK